MVEANAQLKKELGPEMEQVKASFDEKREKKQNQAAIEKSHAIQEARLAKIDKRQMKISEIANEVSGEAKSLAQDATFITNLIVQSCLMLLEPEVSVKCKEADKTIVKSCLSQAEATYKRVISEQTGVQKELSLKLDDACLPSNLIGGVTCSVHEGNITVDNTIDARLKLVLEQDKPAIRRALFPTK